MNTSSSHAVTSRKRKYYRKAYKYARKWNYPRKLPYYADSSNQVFNITRSTFLAPISTSATNNISGAYSFQLDTVAQYQEFSNMWEFYRIRGVQITFTPKSNQVINSNDLPSPILSIANAPDFHYCITYREASAPTAVSDLAARQSYKRFNTATSKPHHVTYIKPCYANTVYSSPVTSGYTAVNGGWISTTNPSVPHYGLLFLLPAFPVAIDNAIVIDVQVRYFLSFKTLR